MPYAAGSSGDEHVMTDRPGTTVCPRWHVHQATGLGRTSALSAASWGSISSRWWGLMPGVVPGGGPIATCYRPWLPRRGDRLEVPPGP